MKKKLFFAALAITALVSCSESDYLGDERPSPVSSSDEVAIGFGSGLRAITRADVTGKSAADSLNHNFVVYGVKSDGTPFGDNQECDTVFDHYNVNWVENTANTTTSNTANWEYVAQTNNQYGPNGDQTIKYWDYAKKQYDFIAYSLGKSTGLTVTEINTKTAKDENNGAYKISGSAAELAKAYIADLVTVCRDNPTTPGGGDYGQEVDIKFRSLSAKVRIGLYEIVPGYSVKDVVFYTDASTAATDGEAHLYTTGSDKFNESGTYIVYFPTTGTNHHPDSTDTGMDPNSDYNKAHLRFTPNTTGGTTTDKAFGALTGSLAGTGFAASEKSEASDNYLGRTSNTATYAGNYSSKYYTVVIPNEVGAVLNLKVNYTLVSTDGDGETIDVIGATAQVPAVYAAWKSGYAYTYLFKISHNSNGYTNPDVGPAGLYPITLDAVVVNSEADGIQETITTVADPSITTYSKGEVVTANNEYKTGQNIYVVVENGSALKVGTNANLYTVTLESDAAQTINEASVANALANGSQNPAGTWTVTDANGKSMVVTSANGLTAVTEIAAADAPDGNAITVNGAKFLPAAATYAAISGNPESGKTYYTSADGAGEFVSDGTAAPTGTTYYEKTSTSAGTYVFEYIGYDDGTVLTSGTDVTGYYTESSGTYTAASGYADGSTSYYKQIKSYKIIKVVD